MNVGLGRVFVYLLGVTLIVLSVGGAALLAVVATERGTALAAAMVARSPDCTARRIARRRCARRPAPATPAARIVRWTAGTSCAAGRLVRYRTPARRRHGRTAAHRRWKRPGRLCRAVAVRLRRSKDHAPCTIAEPLALARLAAALELARKTTLSNLTISRRRAGRRGHIRSGSQAEGDGAPAVQAPGGT